MPGKTKRKRRKRKKNNTKKFKYLKSKCSPKKDEDKLNFTCYTKKGLHKIRNIWNIKHPDRKILSNEPRNIWRSLQYIFNNSYVEESCWIKQNVLEKI